MLDVTIKVHDRYQLETKFNHQFDKDKSITSYKIDTYFFVPSSLKIEQSTYKKSDFYNDAQNYIRFKTPVYLLEQIVAEQNSPYSKLKLACEKLIENPNEKTKSTFEYHTKMFCSILKSSLRDIVEFISSKNNRKEIEYLTQRYIKSVKMITEKYRTLKDIINVPTLEKNIIAIFSFGDEYNSLLVNKYTFKLIECLNKIEYEEIKGLKNELLSLIAQEINYRKANGYDSIPKENSDNELYIFRYSILKKYMESVLFVETSKRSEGILLKQLLISIAAGLAMLFATAIGFWGHYKFGNYSLSLFFVLIVSYMFKDRIKELTRIYFTEKLTKGLYDHKIKIHLDNKKIGNFRESFDFIGKHNVPKTVMKMRNYQRSKEFDNKFAIENIIRYEKKIELYKNFYKKNYHDYNILGINDILRFNFTKFLRKMDNPNKPIYLLTSDGYKKITAKRVYHLNMIIKYEMDNLAYYSRYRIILSRHGIKRIEKVMDDINSER